MTRARDLANLIGSGNFTTETLTATAGQTAFTPSNTFTSNFLQVFYNGLLLDPTVDYTENGTTITLTVAATAGDEMEVVTYNTFSVGDAITQTEADVRYVNASGDTMSGGLGIGISNPSSYQYNADDLVVGNLIDAGTGITIVSGTSSLGSIHFADSPTGDDSYRGFIQYGHAGNYLRFATDAVERMRIDASGRVTMPYQPAFHAIYADGYTVTLTSGTRYALHGRALTNRGNHYNTSTGYFTAPVSGVYAFSIGLAANAAAHSSGFIVVEAEINSTIKSDLYSSSSDIIAQGEGGHSSVEWVVSLNAGDYFRPYYYTSVSYETGGGSNSWTQARNFFAGYLIG